MYLYNEIKQLIESEVDQLSHIDFQVIKFQL